MKAGTKLVETMILMLRREAEEVAGILVFLTIVPRPRPRIRVDKVRQGDPESAGDIRVRLQESHRPWQLNEVALIEARITSGADVRLDCFLCEESGLIPETIEGPLLINDPEAVSPH